MSTEREEIIAAAAKRIMQLEDERNLARRELTSARGIIRELLRAFVADYEGTDGEAGLEYKATAYRRAERFLEKRRRKPSSGGQA